MSQKLKERKTDKETEMINKPESKEKNYVGSNKLKDKVSVITGGDSGIGRAISIAFAKEGADVVVVYLKNSKDADETKKLIEAEDRQCLEIEGDIGDEKFCQEVIKQTVKKFGRIDILINNAGEQKPQKSIEDISSQQLEKTFRTNVFSMFYLTKAALKYMKKGSTIINTASITAYRGNDFLLDYSSTKGAIVSFTYSLSQSLADLGIRVNAVAPGPIWTPLITSTFPKEKLGTFGNDTPMKRPGQPDEVAPAFVFLASDDSSYITGQVIHVNGGEIVHG
jgi:NAD(P)-dependent dehydrogenase (short-subunit alcohol dehydrogenase family)